MQELLWKPSTPCSQLNDQRYFELHLFDSVDPKRPGFIVEQSCAVWSEEDAQFMWEETETERFLTREAAEKSYSARRSALFQLGYTISDVESLIL